MNFHLIRPHINRKKVATMSDATTDTKIENGTMLQAFSWYMPADGRHWSRLAKMAPSLARMGITAVWLPPAYKTADGDHGVGYGVYDLWDLGEFDQCGSVRTKYGTKKGYLSCVAALRDAGIQAMGDIVLNQRFGGEETEHVRAVEVDPADRTKQVGEEKTIAAWTRFRFPGRGGTYSDFTWDWTCFHGTDWDEDAKKSSVYLFAGKEWDDDVDHADNGNYDYLMGSDVDVNDPRVAEELTRWGEWYIRETGVDGLRLDALKHISKKFYRSWLAQMRASCGRELFTVGEYWSPRLEDLIDYLGEDEPMSLFDVPLHYKFFFASNSMGQQDLSKLFEDTLVDEDPIHAVTFVDNHDTQPGQALQSTVEAWFKPSAYMAILLREAGYPCVFYGDLFGLPTEDENAEPVPAVAELPLLMEVRQKLSYGAQHDYLGETGSGGWTWEKDERGFEKPYPWLLADTGALDILGNPTGDLFWAQSVWKVLARPAISVKPPNHPGVEVQRATWRGTNSIPSWSWRGCEGNLAPVEVYFPCKHVELWLNGELVARRRCRDGRTTFLTRYEPGVLTAVALDEDDHEIARSELRTASDLHTQVRPEQGSVRPGGLVYFDVWIGDEGIAESNADLPLQAQAEGGELLAFGSARPRTEERFTTGSYTSYYGRAQAIVRAGAEGRVRLTVTSDLGMASADIAIEVG